jgi:hypothetical protein
VEVPEGALVSENVSHFLRIALGRLGDPRKFLAQIMKGFASSTSLGHNVVELKEGRVFERHSEPELLAGSNIGRVSELRKSERELRKSEGALQTAKEAAETANLSRAHF